jgi:hypothetical protein
LVTLLLDFVNPRASRTSNLTCKNSRSISSPLWRWTKIDENFRISCLPNVFEFGVAIPVKNLELYAFIRVIQLEGPASWVIWKK